MVNTTTSYKQTFPRTPNFQCKQINLENITTMEHMTNIELITRKTCHLHTFIRHTIFVTNLFMLVIQKEQNKTLQVKKKQKRSVD